MYMYVCVYSSSDRIGGRKVFLRRLLVQIPTDPTTTTTTTIATRQVAPRTWSSLTLSLANYPSHRSLEGRSSRLYPVSAQNLYK